MIVFTLAMPAFVEADDQDDGNNAAVEATAVNSVDADDDDAVEEEDEDESGDDSATTSEAMKTKREKIKEEIKKRLENRKGLASKIAEEHRSAVATFIKSLLNVADRKSLGGIGDKVREIAKAQNEMEDKIGPALDKVKKRNKAAKFLFGADLEAVKEAKSQIKEAQAKLAELEKTKDEAASAEDKAALSEQIANLKSSYETILADVEAEGEKTGVFGWLKKFLRK